MELNVNCVHWQPGDRPHRGLCAIGAKNKPSPGACHACTVRQPLHAPIDLVLRNFQGAGDQVLLTAVLRDLHKTFPDRYRTAVECWGRPLFEGNPYVTPLEQLSKAVKPCLVEGFEVGDDQPHLVVQFARSLSRQLGVAIVPTKLGGDVRLTLEERAEPPPFDGEPYWLAWFGGHWGFTTKLWDPVHAQAVVDHFRGKLRFVQCGAREHFHTRIDGATDLVGETPLRRMVKLMHHARGGVGPISFGMHLAAAVPTAPGLGVPLRRPFVVLAGGREAPGIFGYPNHTILHTVGKYRCCLGGACFRNHCDPYVGAPIDCEQPMETRHLLTTPQGPRRLQLARCMVEGVKPRDVIEAIEGYESARASAALEVERRAQRQRRAGLVVLPVCMACEHNRGQRSATTCFCDQLQACCGEAFGAVDVTEDNCPREKFAGGKLLESSTLEPVHA